LFYIFIALYFNEKKMNSAQTTLQKIDLNKDDLGLRGLVILAGFHGVSASAEDIKHRFDPEGKGLDKNGWLLAAKDLGLKVRLSKQPASRMHLAVLPALVWRKDGNHCVIAKCEDSRVLTHNLKTGKPEIFTREQFLKIYEGVLIVVASRASIMGKLAKFDFTWFIPAIIKYRRILLEVVLISVVIQMFALITPLFFQVVMDKVLVHRGFTTLDVIVMALAVVTVFEIILSGLRTFIFAHTTSRIDVELGARLFRH
jgi:subfamily B ATP-binding cassette protein HlyB/CyaB